MASHKQGPQFMKKRFQFEYSGDNDKQYRDNWDRIFGKKPPANDDGEEKGAVFVTDQSVPLIHRCDDPSCYCNTSPGTQLELPFPKES